MKLQRIPPEDWESRLLPEWSGLLENVSEPSIFLSPEWLISWRRHFAAERDTLLVTARDETGALVGLAPFYRRRLGPGRGCGPRVLSFLGDEGVGSEYLGVLVRAGAEERFSSALARNLEGEWSLADLRGLREGRTSDALIRSLASPAPGLVYLERHPCASIPLPDDYEVYLASLGSKFRTTVRYRTNKLTKNFAVRLVRTESEADLDGHLRRFFEMHQGRWAAEGHSGSFYHPRKRAFYRDVASALLRAERLRFFHLEVDGVLRAAQFGFAYHGVLHSLQEAFDVDFRPPGVGGVGVVLRGMAIRESIREGLKAYDFLGGDEEFKTRWGTSTHYVRRARIGAPGFAGGLAYLCTARVRSAKLWMREHFPKPIVEARDRWRVRRQARRARGLAGTAKEIGP